MFNFRKAMGILLICSILTPVCCCKPDGNNLQSSDIDNTSLNNHLDCIQKDNEVMINLEETRNTRDLGGYKTSEGKTTQRNIFFRSDNTNNLTDSDIQKLKEEHNLKHVIDLRYGGEISSCADKLSNIPEINYYNIPLYISKEQMIDLIKGNIDLGDAYISSLDQKETVKNIFDTIANVNKGSLLFHCKNGKDRTGVVAALLLGLCEVSDEDITDDYSITYDLIKDSEAVKKSIEKYKTDVIFKSSPEYMIKLLNHIRQNYTSVENYLINCGVSKENIDKIKNRFIS